MKTYERAIKDNALVLQEIQLLAPSVQSVVVSNSDIIVVTTEDGLTAQQKDDLAKYVPYTFAEIQGAQV